jgi:glyoxylase-like metal-dependent hydrolase (beta-lactamase superfamily II)/8-oxo-dGTP pyrophosphatase MutT (NUDIX family)
MDSTAQSSKSPGPEPTPAATVIIVRAGSEGPEVLLTARPRSLRFMGGAIVFPGGAVAAEDADPRWEGFSVRSRAAACAALGIDDEALALAYFVGAAREAFEEVGFIAGRGPLERVRHVEGAAGLLEQCSNLGVVLGTDELVPAGRWITPFGAPARFDARFFVVAAPPGWTPEPNEREVGKVFWVTPERALAELAGGRLVMAPPTIHALQRLAGHNDVGELMATLSHEFIGPGKILAATVHPLVQVVLAPNANLMTGPGTNTYIIGAGPTIVVDPAVPDPQFIDVVESAAAEVAAIVVTHRHGDHIGGVEHLTRHTGAPVRAHGSEPIDGVSVAPLNDGEELRAGDVAVTTLHTPGHSPDHLCLSMGSSLFSGDTILGEGTPVIAPPDGNMTDYMSSLRRLAALNVGRIYPGHWKVIERGNDVIHGYIRHRLEREAAIKQALSRGPITVEEIVEAVYADTPAPLRAVARYSVLAHLEMLRAAGAVDPSSGKWRLTAAPTQSDAIRSKAGE